MPSKRVPWRFRPADSTGLWRKRVGVELTLLLEDLVFIGVAAHTFRTIGTERYYQGWGSAKAPDVEHRQAFAAFFLAAHQAVLAWLIAFRAFADCL
jgi:hypothetical protein